MWFKTIAFCPPADSRLRIWCKFCIAFYTSLGALRKLAFKNTLFIQYKNSSFQTKKYLVEKRHNWELSRGDISWRHWPGNISGAPLAAENTWKGWRKRVIEPYNVRIIKMQSANFYPYPKLLYSRLNCYNLNKIKFMSHFKTILF